MSESTQYFFYDLPKHKPPVFKEAKTGDVIHYGSSKEPYADYLIDLYNQSVRHNAIVNGLNRFVTGGGWSVESAGLTTEQRAKAEQIIKRCNPDQDINDLSSDAEKSIDIFGGVPLHIIRTQDGDDISEVYVLPFSCLRAVQVNSDKDKPEYKWCYLPSWKGITKYDVAKTKPGFRDFDEFTGEEGQKEGIYIWKYPRVLKQGEVDIYPLPEYAGAIPYIEADVEIGNFDINNVKNQFWGGQIIEMRNVFKTEDEKDDFVEDFKKRKQGTDNAGEVMFVFPNGDSQGVTATPLQPSEIDKQIEVLNQRIEKNIFLAHNFNKKLFGIDENGNPFSRSELADIYEINYSQNIRPKQQILEDIFNWVYSFSSIRFKLKLNKLPLVDLGENDEQGRVLEALNSLSPLIAGKVLDSMNKEQILALVGLKTQPTTTTVITESISMAHDDKIADYFEASGSTDYEQIRSYKFEGHPNIDDYFVRRYFVEVLDVEIGALEADVLSAIKSNPKITPQDLASALDIRPSQATKIIQDLLNAGVLKGEIGSLEITKRAGRDIAEEDVLLDIEVRYTYSGPKDSRNRSFCSRLLSQVATGKTWSREEIDRLSNDQEYNTDAWVYRGGFYTRKGTDDTTPYCRHHWEAVIVKKKKK